jgi:hypothetical protein
MKTTLLEKLEREGRYGMSTAALILDTDTHGRLLISDGFGGLDSLEGGAYRWKHGVVVRLKAADTFDILAEPWNDYTDTLSAVLAGDDPERPVQPFYGPAIDKIARRHAAQR